MNLRHFEAIQRMAPVRGNNSMGCNWIGSSLQRHLRKYSTTQCSLFYTASSKVPSNQKFETYWDQLLEVDYTDSQWRNVVRNGFDNFKRLTVDLKHEEKTKLVQKFKEAKEYFECVKCGTLTCATH